MSAKLVRCRLTNEEQHEKAGFREVAAERAAGDDRGNGRTRCLPVKLRERVIKPNVNCVIADRASTSSAREVATIERSAVRRPLASSLRESIPSPLALREIQFNEPLRSDLYSKSFADSLLLTRIDQKLSFAKEFRKSKKTEERKKKFNH